MTGIAQAIVGVVVGIDEKGAQNEPSLQALYGQRSVPRQNWPRPIRLIERNLATTHVSSPGGLGVVIRLAHKEGVSNPRRSRPTEQLTSEDGPIVQVERAEHKKMSGWCGSSSYD